MAKWGVPNYSFENVGCQPGYNTGVSVVGLSHPTGSNFDFGNGGYQGTSFNRPGYFSCSQLFSTGAPLFNNNLMRGWGRGHGYFKPKLICQVCGKTGHYVLQCYHRFDQEYQGFLASNSGPQMHFVSHNTQAHSQNNFSGGITEPVQALIASNYVSHNPSCPPHSFLGFHDYLSHVVPKQFLSIPCPSTILPHSPFASNLQPTNIDSYAINPLEIASDNSLPSASLYQVVATPQTL